MPDISPIGHGSVGPIKRPTESAPSQRPLDKTETSGRRSDRVELSDHARLLDQLRDLPGIRQDLVDNVREAIARGSYESPQRLGEAIERLFADLDE